MRQKKQATIPRLGLPGTLPLATPRWQMWLAWLEDEQLAPRKRLLEALLHASLPPQLLHHFAYDCAARALALATQSGMVAPPLLREGLARKRERLAGEHPPGSLEETRSRLTEWGMQRASTLEKDCALSIAWSLEEAPITAARYASLHVQLKSEYEWQRAHLTHMLRQLLDQRAGLLWRLRHRQLTLSGRLQTLQAQLEDALFER